MTTKLMLALLGTSALVAAPAPAQTPPATAATGNPAPDQASAVGSAPTSASPATAATNNPEPDQADASMAPEAPPTPEEAASQNQFLQAQVDALQAQLDALKKQMTTAQPGWKGAPQFSSGTGFSFKPKGFAQFDAGYIDTPGPKRSGTAGGLNYNNLGFNTRARRIVIGGQGTLPGGFGYNVELQLAQGTVDYEDIVLTYNREGSPFQATIGNFYPLSSLDTMTSSRVTSFMERAALTDAFNYNRRIGVALGFSDPTSDRYTLTAGVWSQPINDATNFNRTGWQASIRGTFSPTFGSTRLHLGVNYQHRVNQKDFQNVQYRSRPFLQTTDQRFVDTGQIASKGDDILGVELAAIHGPLHFAGEAQKVWVDGYRPGHVFGDNNATNGILATGLPATPIAAFYNDDPSFFSAYGEVGFFLTGETRGYKGGKWDRTKVLKPFDQGGIGAIQINARYDYLDLKDRVGGGGTLAAPDYVNGGTQTGYELSLIWTPMDYVRFMLQYARAHVEGGPRATTVDPGSTKDANDRKYNVNTFGARAQVDF